MRWLRGACMVALLLCTLAEGARRGEVMLTGVVNLNEASAEELDLLPGVGAKAAAGIMAHRRTKPFRRIEELVQVKGFGKKRFDRLKPYLTLQGPTTLKRTPRSAP
ncbi:MAG TPA: helix-hairpin-helix domain-containing protein [Myxococcaceae bacterium]|nr:helix-hairpin-helix domain-containing protein [Myxococcaceae bacterium]